MIIWIRWIPFILTKASNCFPSLSLHQNQSPRNVVASLMKFFRVEFMFWSSEQKLELLWIIKWKFKKLELVFLEGAKDDRILDWNLHLIQIWQLKEGIIHILPIFHYFGKRPRNLLLITLKCLPKILMYPWVYRIDTLAKQVALLSHQAIGVFFVIDFLDCHPVFVWELAKPTLLNQVLPIVLNLFDQFALNLTKSVNEIFLNRYAFVDVLVNSLERVAITLDVYFAGLALGFFAANKWLVATLCISADSHDSITFRAA